jgi:hypothetical protein
MLVWHSLRRRRRDFLALDGLRRQAEQISAELVVVNQRQKRFNANAAHELRTPLAILRARLDAMGEDEDVRALKRDVDDMVRQVELLLELARTETVTTGANAEIDLGQLAQVPWVKGFVFGAVLGGIGQVGDLFESMMKRDAEVKDSGSSIPGFGGILDVTDSPLLAAPFAYLLFSLPW